MSENLSGWQDMLAGILPHLIELRRRLLIAFAALAVGMVVGFMVAEPVLAILARPVGGLENLQAIELTESVGVYVRVAMLVGAIIAMPIIVYVVFEKWFLVPLPKGPLEDLLNL